MIKRPIRSTSYRAFNNKPLERLKMANYLDCLGPKGLTLVAIRAPSRILPESLPPGQQTGYIVGSTALVCIAGLAAGLTLGLLSLDRCN